MRAGRPAWQLHATSPCCGQGVLVLACGPRCRHVLLICAEVGTCSPHDLASRVDARCPACGAVSELENATSEQIRALGVTPDLVG